MPVAQVNNPQMIDILSSKFQDSGDPSFLQRIVISKYLHLPGLRGFWGVTYRNDTAYAGAPYIQDMTGGGYHVPTVGAVPTIYTGLGRTAFGFNGANYAALADNAQFDIIGSEAWVNAPGIALGGWVRSSRARPYAGIEGIVSKWLSAGNQQSYLLMLDNNNPNVNGLTLGLSTTGANYYSFDHSKPVLQNTWYFTAATWNPGALFNEPAGVRLWVNDVKEYHNTSDRASGAAGLPATIFNSTAALQFASLGGAAGLLSGFEGYWWLCGNYLQELEIFNLYETTKILFGYAAEKGSSW